MYVLDPKTVCVVRESIPGRIFSLGGEVKEGCFTVFGCYTADLGTRRESVLEFYLDHVDEVMWDLLERHIDYRRVQADKAAADCWQVC